ncbi:hypothetical protein [Robbsia andropogonis]|uniref:hypothetical protein n=1 Tax=Robbsia andropogonis TaxID=28092 RepID=UPI00209D52BD|nr:hypothetical protein [Robbsia andropogonis]MCP1117008.1 hypothetical protein [Robbsia andropogonis]MCP1126313.1 hypothetical protein [Robbsia andropogonis]
MIRFIIKRRSFDQHIDLNTETFYTVDCDVPELEAVLSRGGHGPSGFEMHDLFGVEILSKGDGHE